MFRSIGFIASKMSNILAALSIVKQLTYLVSFLLACRACQTLVGGAELVVQLDVSVQASPKKKKKKKLYTILIKCQQKKYLKTITKMHFFTAI